MNETTNAGENGERIELGSFTGLGESKCMEAILTQGNKREATITVASGIYFRGGRVEAKKKLQILKANGYRVFNVKAGGKKVEV